jgi:hypothetical protein
MVLSNDTIIKVTNRNACTVGYDIPDLGNLYRNFQPNETKEIPMNELRKLSYLPGGRYILENYLILDNQDAIDELINGVEPEYFYTEKEVRELLLSGSLDQLKDCLDFGPKGVIESVKKIAVETRLNDVAKRDAIFKATGFNVTKAIEINDASTADEDAAAETKTRRASPVAASIETTGRRVAVPADKYKITSIAK